VRDGRQHLFDRIKKANHGSTHWFGSGSWLVLVGGFDLGWGKGKIEVPNTERTETKGRIYTR
jgi:hypothetical protein